ncbi:MAG: transcriptional repressor [Planctomycetes bacterium]|nr:transcriptional repressor [Planctomycetota bacterium]
MTSEDTSIERFHNQCREAGYRATAQRTQIYREVIRASGHPDAETVYENVSAQYPSISRDTVYRTLSLLDQLGIISQVSLLNDRARFDPRTDQHHHFICAECGAIFDFTSEEADNLPLPDTVKSFGRIHSHRVQVRGVCNRCNQETEQV